VVIVRNELAPSIVLAMLLAAPLALASTHVEQGPVVVIVDDDRGQSCSTSVGPACELNVTLDPLHPQDGVIDAGERFHYIGVALNVPFMPDTNITTNGSDLYAPDPLLPDASVLWNQEKPDTSGVTNDTFTMNTSGIHFDYYGPTLADPTAPAAWHDLGLDYAPPGKPGLHYNETGPFNGPNGTADTDSYWNGNTILACHETNDQPACYQGMGEARSAYENTTPDVRFGIEWDTVQAASNASDLTPPKDAPLVNATAARPSDTHAENESAQAQHSGGENETTSHEAPPDSPPIRQNRTNTSPPFLVKQASRTTLVPSPPPGGPLRAIAVAVAVAGIIIFILVAYSRFFTPDELLQGETRRYIAELVQAQPGVTTTRLGELLGLDRTTIRYHVQVLQRRRLLAVVRCNDEIRIYPVASRSRPTAPPVGGVSPSEAILRLVRQRPTGVSRAEIAEELSHLSSRTRNGALKRLLRDGVLVEERTRAGLLLIALA
jgi:hypothetical protein